MTPTTAEASELAIKVTENAIAQMRDGTDRRRDVCTPRGEGSWPVLVRRTDYGERGETFGSNYIQTATGSAQRGYMAVVQDVRARYASSASVAASGTARTLTIDLGPVGIRFEPGSGIRPDISMSDFPNFDRNHNTGADYWSDTGLRPARQTVHSDSQHRSRLTLPLGEDA